MYRGVKWAVFARFNPDYRAKPQGAQPIRGGFGGILDGHGSEGPVYGMGQGAGSAAPKVPREVLSLGS